MKVLTTNINTIKFCKNIKKYLKKKKKKKKKDFVSSRNVKCKIYKFDFKFPSLTNFSNRTNL